MQNEGKEVNYRGSIVEKRKQKKETPHDSLNTKFERRQTQIRIAVYQIDRRKINGTITRNEVENSPITRNEKEKREN